MHDPDGVYSRNDRYAYMTTTRIGNNETGTGGVLALPASLRQNLRDVDELGEVLQTRRGFLGSRSKEVRREHEAVLPSASSLGKLWESLRGLTVPVSRSSAE